jgi:osmotically-inducible protein OsmY
MFMSILPVGSLVGAQMAGLCAAVSSALAYAAGLDGARIEVSQDSGVIYLDGSAPSLTALETALSVARDIAGNSVCNRIEPAY